AVAENLPVLRKDGSVFYVNIASSNVRYNGQPCAVGIFHDVTERKRSQEALQQEHQLLHHLLASQDRERQLIAYEIHDGLAQYLVAAIMQFEAVQRSASAVPDPFSANCDAGMAMLRKSLVEARRLISGLRPPILDESGVVAAIGHLVHEVAAQGGPKVQLRNRLPFHRLDPLLENAVYRIVQECLTNAQRHSHSEKVRIDLLEENGRIRIQVTDWGRGFDPDAVPPERFGLDGIRQRARILGGKAEINSRIGQGTTVLVELPKRSSQTLGPTTGNPGHDGSSTADIS
ncbi:MAG: sensor histidine kinase, partial [Thermoguttaceae bacterium]